MQPSHRRNGRDPSPVAPHNSTELTHRYFHARSTRHCGQGRRFLVAKEAEQANASVGELAWSFAEEKATLRIRRVRVSNPRGRGYTMFLTDKAEAVLCFNSPQRGPVEIGRRTDPAAASRNLKATGKRNGGSLQRAIPTPVREFRAIWRTLRRKPPPNPAGRDHA